MTKRLGVTYGVLRLYQQEVQIKMVDVYDMPNFRQGSLDDRRRQRQPEQGRRQAG
ncbi:MULTISPECIES: hypothetical protein [unclassified Microbispora]|uniref:hypothetical protein n=1 Tax=unclassified Microbispora TaxID=2614687 RepID=UPI0014387D92|nr:MULTISPECIES: hypothetical protein [unclassified Microbispora]NJP29904.1 hypothetical protein [Microbispora sp. CL1-1]